MAGKEIQTGMGTEELNRMKCVNCGHLDTERFDTFGYCDIVGIFVEKEQTACISHTEIKRPIGFTILNAKKILLTYKTKSK